MRSRCALSAALSTALVASLTLPCLAGAAHASRSVRHTVARRAPSAPPLGAIAPQGAQDSSAGVPPGAGDPLVENGLSSPFCKGATSAGLSSAAQGNCRTSSFVGASAPTGSYAIDVNIDVGPFGLSKGGLLSVIQDMFVTPLWNALVWVVHALVVMLEWCYTLELLDGPTMGGVSRSLRQAQASFTEPWLALVLALASVLALYNGLIRRRVGETLGQALVTLAMMAAGLWMIADPLGTVGAIGQWANQASLGTLGAVAHGTPANASRTLADSMRALFAGAIEMPWCYLEFGNVRWCSDPALLDQRLRKAGLLIEARQKAMIGCKPSTVAQLCASVGSPAALMVEHSDWLMRQATTNGELFLAFPANGPERNSVTEKGSLLHVLCQTEDDTKCTGPTAAQAEFRSDSGTLPRMIGVALIAAGVLGMVLLFGLIAVHLLAAAVVSLLMLLLAPLVVLAPALGDGGRAVFGAWLTRLLGAVSSKLLFSFLLGALLTLQRILTSLQPLGWTEWLLISVFWWAAFLKRHRALAVLQARGATPLARDRRTIGQRLEAFGRAQVAVRHPVRWAKSKVFPPLPVDERLRRRPPGGSKRDGKRADGHRTDGLGRARTLEHAIVPHARGGSRVNAGTLVMRAQLQRLRGARETALARGDRRRATKLAVRERRVEAELTRERERTATTGPDAERSAVRTPSAPDPSSSTRARESRAGRLDRGTASPGSPDRRGDIEPPADIHAGGSGNRRDTRPQAGGTTQPGVGGAPRDARERRSSVMDDARAVAEGRKRQLGFGPDR
jgi:hypothetical protein